MACYRLLLFNWLIIVYFCTLTTGRPYMGRQMTQRGNSGVQERSIRYVANISSWKYPQRLLSFNDRPEDLYEDEHFKRELGKLMSISSEDDEKYFPYGMYPYLFPGTNPYQFGHCEAKVFQKEAMLDKAIKTPAESILSVAPFLTYIFLWLYIEFLAVLILPLTGFILFRFVALPLGEFIGGKRTRRYLRHLVITIEKKRRDWIKWLWPKDRSLPPWRYKTPKILRNDNEGSVPWELMEEKELCKLYTQYPERWQLDKRLQKWKMKAMNPECYADKWVFKMIHRKLLRDRSFYVAPNTAKYKWGDSTSTTSSGTSTSSEEEQESQSEQSKFDLSLGTATMKSLSQLHMVRPGINRVEVKESTYSMVFTDDYKTRRASVFNKNPFDEEFLNLKSSHRGIILDQSDQQWPNYAGEIYQNDYENLEPKSRFQLKGWDLVRMVLGPKKHYEDTMKKWKPKKSQLVLRKGQIDNLARVEKKVSATGRSTMIKTDDTKVTYNLALLEKIRRQTKSSKRIRKKTTQEVTSSITAIKNPPSSTAKKLFLSKILSKPRSSFFSKTKLADTESDIPTSKAPNINRKQSIKVIPHDKSKTTYQPKAEKKLLKNVVSRYNNKLNPTSHKIQTVDDDEVHNFLHSQKTKDKEGIEKSKKSQKKKKKTNKK